MQFLACSSVKQKHWSFLIVFQEVIMYQQIPVQYLIKLIKLTHKLATACLAVQKNKHWVACEHWVRLCRSGSPCVSVFYLQAPFLLAVLSHHASPAVTEIQFQHVSRKESLRLTRTIGRAGAVVSISPSSSSSSSSFFVPLFQSSHFSRKV